MNEFIEIVFIRKKNPNCSLIIVHDKLAFAVVNYKFTIPCRFITVKTYKEVYIVDKKYIETCIKYKKCEIQIERLA